MRLENTSNPYENQPLKSLIRHDILDDAAPQHIEQFTQALSNLAATTEINFEQEVYNELEWAVRFDHIEFTKSVFSAFGPRFFAQFLKHVYDNLNSNSPGHEAVKRIIGKFIEDDKALGHNIESSEKNILPNLIIKDFLYYSIRNNNIATTRYLCDLLSAQKIPAVQLPLGPLLKAPFDSDGMNGKRCRKSTALAILSSLLENSIKHIDALGLTITTPIWSSESEKETLAQAISLLADIKRFNDYQGKAVFKNEMTDDGLRTLYDLTKKLETNHTCAKSLNDLNPDKPSYEGIVQLHTASRSNIDGILDVAQTIVLMHTEHMTLSKTLNAYKYQGNLPQDLQTALQHNIHLAEKYVAGVCQHTRQKKTPRYLEQLGDILFEKSVFTSTLSTAIESKNIAVLHYLFVEKERYPQREEDVVNLAIELENTALLRKFVEYKYFGKSLSKFVLLTANASSQEAGFLQKIVNRNNPEMFEIAIKSLLRAIGGFCHQTRTMTEILHGTPNPAESDLYTERKEFIDFDLLKRHLSPQQNMDLINLILNNKTLPYELINKILFKLFDIQLKHAKSLQSTRELDRIDQTIKQLYNDDFSKDHSESLSSVLQTLQSRSLEPQNEEKESFEKRMQRFASFMGSSLSSARVSVRLQVTGSPADDPQVKQEAGAATSAAQVRQEEDKVAAASGGGSSAAAAPAPSAPIKQEAGAATPAVQVRQQEDKVAAASGGGSSATGSSASFLPAARMPAAATSAGSSSGSDCGRKRGHEQTSPQESEGPSKKMSLGPK